MGKIYKVKAKQKWYENNKTNKRNIKFLSKADAEARFIAPDIELVEAAFNYEPGLFRNDAYDLRENHNSLEDYRAPEYSINRNKRSSPILYSARQKPNIIAYFKLKPDILQSLEAYANSLDSSEMKQDDNERLYLNPLGNLKFTTCLTKKDGLIPVVLTSEIGIPEKILKTKQAWSWEASKIHGMTFKWENALITKLPNQIYVILDKPIFPWKIDKKDSPQNPWVTALDFVINNCGAKSHTNKLDTAKTITKYLHTGGLWEYPESNDNKYPAQISEIINNNSTLNNTRSLNYTKFISGKDVGIAVNCADSALSLSATARLVGINLEPQKQVDAQNIGIHCFTIFNNLELVFDCCRAKEFIEKLNNINILYGGKYENYQKEVLQSKSGGSYPLLLEEIK